jgi:2-polyprenyl-3-methyl-5-hydroxy-6-metoxy-1,4-benzoquinol methylase
MTIIALDDCPICHCRDFTGVPRPTHWIGEAFFSRHSSRLGLMRCRNCNFVFVNPRPDRSVLEAFYSAHDFATNAIEAHDPAVRRAAFQLAEVERLKSPGREARLLDYGCGEGLLLRQALDAGWNAIGYDIGDPAVSACRLQRLPIVSALDDIHEMQFDVIVLSHVFEHLTDLSQTLDYLKAKLAPGGLLCLEVPNAKSLRAMLSAPLATSWFGFDERYRAFPIHLSYFTTHTLLRLLRQHDFVAERVTTAGLGIDALIRDREEDEASGTSSRRKRAPRTRDTFHRVAVDAFKKAFFGWGMGENLLVIARVSGHGLGQATR